MNESRLLEAVESSFLAPLLQGESITDISFNGEALFYEDNQLGRKKAEIGVNKEEVGDFLRQVANYAEKQFSYSVPQLDVSFGRYRLNACYPNLVRVGDEHSYSFCLRLLGGAGDFGADREFLPQKAKEILLNAIQKRSSIVIGGVTSSGKTELQKFLIRSLPEAEKAIVIDNAGELERLRGSGNVDITSWSVDERFPMSSFSSLIKNALRNDPDWVILAESRGPEALDALTSAMSGAAIMMTIHCARLESMPSRFARLCMMGENRLLREEVLEDIKGNLPYWVLLEKGKREDGSISRKVVKIGYFASENSDMEIIYQRKAR